MNYYKHCNIRVCVLVAIIISISELVGAYEEETSPEDGLLSRQSLPSPFWMTKREPDLSGSDKLAQLLNRVGPNMRASADYHDFTDIHSSESILAWKMLHKQAKLFAQSQVHFYGPKLEQLARDANVSQSCQKSIQLTLNSLEDLNSWAVQMWSATGNFPPVGLFDGQFSDIGSYRGCVDLNIPQTTTTANSVNYTSYCTVAFRPVVPSRPHFHMIFHELEDKNLLNLFNRTDIFGELLHRAQYFHYIYMKTGVCVPYQCSPNDIQQVVGVVGRRLMLMVGPVKCFTRAPYQSKQHINQSDEYEFGKIENESVLVQLNRSMNEKQLLASILVISFFGTVFFATLWHAAEIGLRKAAEKQQEQEYGIDLDQDEEEERQQQKQNKLKQVSTPIEYNNGAKHIAFHYFSIITNGRDFLDTSMRSNEIKCLHGLRVLTMVWIISVHTLQYNEWSGFTRVFENVATLQNPRLHPIYNANYVVDNFFFMSGLLAAYTTWYANKGTSYNFNAVSSLVGRYLRLTPQVLLISLMYMLLPLAGDGPFWYDMSHYAAKYCEKNWWVNLLHLQAFYREDEICNLVGWWISVDMFYYVLALGIICLILNNHWKRALLATALLIGTCTTISAYRHFTGGYTPNNLGTVPQIGEVWTKYIVNFFWSPYPHAFPFYLGLWIGYMLANNKWRREVRQWSRFGWIVASLSLACVNLSSHIWMSGAVQLDNQYISTGYNNVCVIVWALAFAWVVTACHYGCAPTLNKLLSIKLFVLVSKASFIIYLSHMLLVRMYFGLQNTLLEVSLFTLSYAIVGNTFVSSLFGVFLCVTFEAPCMKFQKYVIQKIKKQKRHSPVPIFTRELENNATDLKVTMAGVGPTTKALLKL